MSDQQYKFTESLKSELIFAFFIFVPITTYMARIGANTVHKLEKAKVQVLFGLFLYVVATIFIYRYFNI